jgi:6-phosphogluconolactonase
MIKKFKNQREASEAMAEAFKVIADEAVKNNGRFTVALTGGNSPLVLHEILSNEPYKSVIPWKNTFVFWGDERAVPFDDDQNNAKMGFQTLLDHVPVPPGQIYRMNSEVPAERAAAEYEAILKKHFENTEPRFDLVLLGMGADGHTASIFPGSEVVHEKSKWVSTGYNAEQKSNRITLTVKLINKARNIFFSVFGDGKAKTLLNVRFGEYDPDTLPSQLINPENGNLYWYIDEAAGKFISKDV